MSTSAVPRNFQIVKSTIKEILLSSDSELPAENIEWAITVWLKIYDELSNSPETLYKGLVLANRKCLVGKFAIIFNHYLYSAINKKNTSSLRSLLMTSSFPELEDNKLLSVSDKDVVSKSLKEEMMALNLMMEKAVRDDSVTTLINSDLHHICKNDVCTINNGNSRFSYGPVKNFKYVSENVDGNVQVYPFKLIELISILSNPNIINPFTNKPFSDSIGENLKVQYHIEISLYCKSQEILNKKIYSN